MFTNIIAALFVGALVFFAGVGVNKLRDRLRVPKRKDGNYNRTYKRGCILGNALKTLGIFLSVIMILTAIFSPH